MSFTYSECVSVSLVTQHAMRMCHIILSSVACYALPYFFLIISLTSKFSEKNIVNIKGVFFIFSANFFRNSNKNSRGY